MGQQIRLIGKKIILRAIEDADLNGPYIKWLKDPDVTRYLEARHSNHTREILKAYLDRFENSDNDLIFAICLSDSGEHIGNVTLNNINKIHGRADSGIIIGAKEYWGQGCAYEAWHVLLDYAFNYLGLRKIAAGAVADNIASLKLQEKLGFKVEGTFRDDVYFEGVYHDVIRTAIFRSDFISL